MKQVIRVEHPDGCGMFVSYTESGQYRPHNVGEICYGIVERHNSFNNPWQDGLNFSPNHYCAYQSIDAIQQWVEKDEFKILFENEYKVYLLEVSDCETGIHNVIFLKENIKSKTDISDLFK